MSATYISTVWFKRAKSSTGMVTQRFNKFTASTLKIDIYRLYENPIYTSQTLRTMMVTGATIQQWPQPLDRPGWIWWSHHTEIGEGVSQGEGQPSGGSANAASIAATRTSNSQPSSQLPSRPEANAGG